MAGLVDTELLGSDHVSHYMPVAVMKSPNERRLQPEHSTDVGPLAVAPLPNNCEILSYQTHQHYSHPSTQLVKEWSQVDTRFRFRFRLHLFQPHQADQMFDPHMTGSSYASKQ